MWLVIFKTTILAGTLDIVAACIYANAIRGTTPAGVLRYVASGIFGASAFTGSNIMLVWGLVFHFTIAFSCTVCYFLLYSKIKLLSRSWIMSAVVIGVMAWCATNLIIVPLSNTLKSPFDITKVLVGLGILIICIGVPIACMASIFFRKR